jgi:broad specificity phosphatase PhoE
VRHAESEGMHDRLVGRTPGIGLTPCGQTQANAAVAYLAGFPVTKIVVSPQQRARETAAIFASNLHVPVESHPDLDELDFGNWTGLRFADLAKLPEWKTFNSLRSLTRAPGGESLREAQTRVLRALLELHSSRNDSTFIIVTHADIIRSALSYLSGAPLDLFLRFSIDPASITTIQFSYAAVQILCVNRTP